MTHPPKRRGVTSPSRCGCKEHDSIIQENGRENFTVAIMTWLTAVSQMTTDMFHLS